MVLLSCGPLRLDFGDEVRVQMMLKLDIARNVGREMSAGAELDGQKNVTTESKQTLHLNLLRVHIRASCRMREEALGSHSS